MNAHTNVRTFRAPDARAALSAVRAALGGEAVILETREVAAGLFGRAQIEVTAAGPAASAPDARRAAAFEDAPLHGTRGKRAAAYAGGNGGDLQSEVTALRRLVEDMRQRMPPAARPASNAGGPREIGGMVDDEAPRFSSEELRTYRHLIRRGMEEFLARGLVEEARRLGASSGDEIEEAVKTSMRKQMAPAAAPWLAEGRRTLALIGPTGVGKTTAIAKIAARALLETRFKVALITVDTYRVGASDQLARYGNIMGIPTHVARDRAALAAGVERFQDADLVLIDTAGRSDNQSLAEQTSLLRSVPQIELQLVLSAAAGGRELGAIARRYRAIAPERMILTKLDEVDGSAGIYSALSALPRPVSCISDGQRVPEDIHAVTGPDLVRIVFGP
ncbi:MAG TPA: flagellar biosynthesis protein FlhF [Polyangia bacterium]|jgi:flagellar biosynthesis protein FlhF|nr:flagellar biosynthesis protein FlhF [Polyangia bacterium]